MGNIKNNTNDGCTNIIGLHATPKKWIPDIIKNGFAHTKNIPSHASSGKGSAEGDIIFFEKYSPRGAKYSIDWAASLENNRNMPTGIVKSTVKSCNYLDKKELLQHKKELAQKGTDFIIKYQGYKESERAWAMDHFGKRLESDDYADPFSFLRKIANDSEYVIYNDSQPNIKPHERKIKGVVRPNIGEVMEFLGYDTADGYAKSHILSRNDKDRNAPINEFIVSDVTKISNIVEITPDELCDLFKSDENVAETCQKIKNGKNRL